MKKRIRLIPIIILVLISLVGCGNSDTSSGDNTTEKSQSKKEYSDVTFENLNNTPDEFKGKGIKIKGEVIQVLENDLRISIDGDIDKIIYAVKDSDSSIAEGDYVEVLGTANGKYTYETVMGSEMTIPFVNIDSISVREGGEISEAVVVVDNDVLKLEFIKITGTELTYKVTNKTDSEITVSMDKIIQNGKQNDIFVYCDVSAGVENEDTTYLNKPIETDVLTKGSIEVIDSDSYSTIGEYDIEFTIK